MSHDMLCQKMVVNMRRGWGSLEVTFLRTKGMLIFRIFHVEFDDDHSQVLCLLCVELSA
jgi:hypothetical protein